LLPYEKLIFDNNIELDATTRGNNKQSMPNNIVNNAGMFRHVEFFSVVQSTQHETSKMMMMMLLLMMRSTLGRPRDG
jgi:hypothetical protein